LYLSSLHSLDCCSTNFMPLIELCLVDEQHADYDHRIAHESLRLLSEVAAGRNHIDRTPGIAFSGQDHTLDTQLKLQHAVLGRDLYQVFVLHLLKMFSHRIQWRSVACRDKCRVSAEKRMKSSVLQTSHEKGIRA